MQGATYLFKLRGKADILEVEEDNFLEKAYNKQLNSFLGDGEQENGAVDSVCGEFDAMELRSDDDGK